MHPDDKRRTQQDRGKKRPEKNQPLQLSIQVLFGLLGTFDLYIPAYEMAPAS